MSKDQAREKNGQFARDSRGRRPQASGPIVPSADSSAAPATDWNLSYREAYAQYGAAIGSPYRVDGARPHPVVVEVGNMIGTEEVELQPGRIAEQVVRYVRAELKAELEESLKAAYIQEGRRLAAQDVAAAARQMEHYDADFSELEAAALGNQGGEGVERTQAEIILDDLCDAISENTRMEAAMMTTDQIQRAVADMNAEMKRIERGTSRPADDPRWIYAYCREAGFRAVLRY